MTDIAKIVLRQPYLVMVGAEAEPAYAKTGFGIVQWRRDAVAGQLRLGTSAVDLGVPDMDVDAAAAAGVGSLILGVAPVGGRIPDDWWEVMRQAAGRGIDVVAGLHTRLNDNVQLVRAAAASGARLVDVRVPPANLRVASGRKRSGMRLLTVGTDCAIGKKYTALATHEAFLAAGIDASFRATGQTGIMIAGEGLPIDSVVADFIAGAAEMLSPDNEASHWDVIEGQGSLFHPAYSGVSMGLLHGSQPDAIVVCHDAVRKTVAGWDRYALPTLDECIEVHERLARRTNPDARVVGISVNTSAIPAELRSSYLEELRRRHKVPAVDPLIDGCADIVEFLRSLFG